MPAANAENHRPCANRNSGRSRFYRKRCNYFKKHGDTGHGAPYRRIDQTQSVRRLGAIFLLVFRGALRGFLLLALRDGLLAFSFGRTPLYFDAP